MKIVPAHEFMPEGRVAVRPNLNLHDTLTVHELNSCDTPQYARALQHIEGGTIFLRDATPHVGAAARRIYEGSTKFPVASVVGISIEEPEWAYSAEWVEVHYDPRIDPDTFWYHCGPRWEGPDVVALRKTRAWVATNYPGYEPYEP